MSVITDKYTEEALFLLGKMFPNATEEEINNAIQYSIAKRKKDEMCTLDNNYTKKNVNLTLEQVTEFIASKNPICTAYGTLFKQPGDIENLLIGMIRYFMEGRDIAKKEMFKYPKGTEKYAKYYLDQILLKRDGNSIYGCLGNATCLLYNLNVAAAITSQGRAVISNATMFFEGFLANNVKFCSLNEVLHYIKMICYERPERKFKDSDILDRNISVDECFAKIILSIGDYKFGRYKWIPDFEDMDIIYNTLRNLDQEDINRIYYKNNIYDFLDNKSMTRALVYIIKSLQTPYMACNDVPEEIKVELDILQDFLREYVYYKHLWMDRIDRCDNMKKKVCAISDTDSTIVCFDPFYRFVLDKIRYEDVPVSKLEFTIYNEEKKQVGIRPFIIPPEQLDFDFAEDKIVRVREMINPYVFLPQDNLRYSIINIIAYICGNLCNEYMVEFTKGNGSWSPDRKCLLYLKNEYLFKTALLTMGKKNYATNQEVQEGNIIPKGIKTQLDIKGLPINKSTLKKSTKDALQKILYEEVLDSEKIDQVRIIRRLSILDKQMRESLASGDKQYYKPVVIKSISRYEDPMRIQGIKASLIWNAVRDDHLDAINLDERNTIDIVKTYITPTNIERIKDTYPEIYAKFVRVFQDRTIFENGKYEITSMAIPINVDSPKWLLEFIDYNTIVNDALTNFPCDSVNIGTLGKSTVNYSNIMPI